MAREKQILDVDFKLFGTLREPRTRDNQALLGNYGEQVVSAHLQRLGYQVLHHNFRTKQGEIDIIARDGNIIVFVEVKTRMAEYFALSQLVPLSKQCKIIRAAKQYLLAHNLTGNLIYRFDIAIVIGQGTDTQIRYIANAFTQQNDV
jgi:putative endonuclease